MDMRVGANAYFLESGNQEVKVSLKYLRLKNQARKKLRSEKGKPLRGSRHQKQSSSSPSVSSIVLPPALAQWTVLVGYSRLVWDSECALPKKNRPMTCSSSMEQTGSQAKYIFIHGGGGQVMLIGAVSCLINFY
ncbi:hypothetical protein BC351_07140 [Paenibacillus ferrarius]|uniref:Uncharacterized protein n=1 Tax=Paenibacillus ferrarius TaxID=1469647 RepID=A0A1V4HBW4_9BACL|nr:hypothetical protein BC351_07140 [Paenibacillus ferrarius]